MALFITNPSRGTSAPLAPGDPTGVKAVDPIRVSLREPTSAIDLTTIQVEVGYAKTHAIGTGGSFEKQLPRTYLGSLFSTPQFANNVSITVSDPELVVEKTSNAIGGSVYFTSVDRGLSNDYNAMLSITAIGSAAQYTHGDVDPIGPVFGLEHGPKKTAVYCFLVDDGLSKQIRICGPLNEGVRVPDIFVPFDWGADLKRYTLVWNEARKQVELWVDDTASGLGGVGNATLLMAIPTSSFQQFEGTGSVPAGGGNDITGIYGVEGATNNSIGISQVALSLDVSFPFMDGARTGGWASYLDSDVTVGFSGKTDPLRMTRGGTWFINPASNDTAGQILPSAGGYCRLLKKTASTNFSIFRYEPGLLRVATDGFAVEFKCATSTSGGAGFATGAAIQISDGTSLFQLDFLFDGSVHNIGLLLVGGDPTSPSDHLLAPTPIDYTLKTLRLVVDPRRALIDLFDTASPAVPLATWTLNRAQLPTSADTTIVIGLPVAGTPATGALDVYSFKYSYIYQAWETRDGTDPTSANPPFAASSTGTGSGPLNAATMPGVLPLPYLAGSGGGSSGTGGMVADGYEITATGGQTLFFDRSAPIDANRGGIFEASLKVTSWHPGERTGVFGILDDSNKAYMISFVETDAAKFVCIPQSAGLGQFQEIVGTTGLGAELSVEIDWTQFHTYRLERRPRDGVYLYIDGQVALVLPDSAGYSFPATQLHGTEIAFGQFTDEGATSVWKFVRGFFGSGYEISTMLAESENDLRTRLTNARTTVVVTAGV